MVSALSFLGGERPELGCRAAPVDGPTQLRTAEESARRQPQAHRDSGALQLSTAQQHHHPPPSQASSSQTILRASHTPRSPRQCQHCAPASAPQPTITGQTTVRTTETTPTATLVTPDPLPQAPCLSHCLRHRTTASFSLERQTRAHIRTADTSQHRQRRRLWQPLQHTEGVQRVLVSRRQAYTYCSAHYQYLSNRLAYEAVPHS